MLNRNSQSPPRAGTCISFVAKTKLVAEAKPAGALSTTAGKVPGARTPRRATARPSGTACRRDKFAQQCHTREFTFTDPTEKVGSLVAIGALAQHHLRGVAGAGAMAR